MLLRGKYVIYHGLKLNNDKKFKVTNIFKCNVMRCHEKF